MRERGGRWEWEIENVDEGFNESGERKAGGVTAGREGIWKIKGDDGDDSADGAHRIPNVWLSRKRRRRGRRDRDGCVCDPIDRQRGKARFWVHGRATTLPEHDKSLRQYSTCVHGSHINVEYFWCILGFLKSSIPNFFQKNPKMMIGT